MTTVVCLLTCRLFESEVCKWCQCDSSFLVLMHFFSFLLGPCECFIIFVKDFSAGKHVEYQVVFSFISESLLFM